MENKKKKKHKKSIKKDNVLNNTINTEQNDNNNHIDNKTNTEQPRRFSKSKIALTLLILFLGCMLGSRKFLMRNNNSEKKQNSNDDDILNNDNKRSKLPLNKLNNLMVATINDYVRRQYKKNNLDVGESKIYNKTMFNDFVLDEYDISDSFLLPKGTTYKKNQDTKFFTNDDRLAVYTGDVGNNDDRIEYYFGKKKVFGRMGAGLKKLIANKNHKATFCIADNDNNNILATNSCNNVCLIKDGYDVCNEKFLKACEEAKKDDLPLVLNIMSHGEENGFFSNSQVGENINKLVRLHVNSMPKKVCINNIACYGADSGLYDSIIGDMTINKEFKHLDIRANGLLDRHGTSNTVSNLDDNEMYGQLKDGINLLPVDVSVDKINENEFKVQVTAERSIFKDVKYDNTGEPYCTRDSKQTITKVFNKNEILKPHALRKFIGETTEKFADNYLKCFDMLLTSQERSTINKMLETFDLVLDKVKAETKAEIENIKAQESPKQQIDRYRAMVDDIELRNKVYGFGRGMSADNKKENIKITQNEANISLKNDRFYDELYFKK